VNPNLCVSASSREPFSTPMTNDLASSQHVRLAIIGSLQDFPQFSSGKLTTCFKITLDSIASSASH
jgi:hypothetical protein